MSAVAPPPRERSEWRGEDVDVDEVAERLLELGREHARHAHGHAATRTLNLLVAPSAAAEPGQIAERIAGLSARHPSRTIVVREHRRDQLDALLEIDCCIAGAPGATGYCHDSVALWADVERLQHADSLVRPLWVSGLPTVLWLPDEASAAAEQPLAQLAEAIVLDSAAAADVAAAVARAQRLGAGRVRDLAWVRLARWRQRVAGHFDDPAARALLPATERLEVRCGAAGAATPLLLAAWIVARAGWTLEGLAAREEGWQGAARRADGGQVVVALEAAPGSPPDIHALRLQGPDGVLEIVEPVGEPDAARAFSAALRRFDEGMPGYEPALATLAGALDPR